MANLFEKLGLVERVEDDIPVDIYSQESDYSEEDVDVEIGNVTQDNIIADVYEGNNLSDLSRSIFKVEEIINNLPNTMTKETMQAAVIGILASFNLTPETVKIDAQNRISILNAALKQVTDENEAIVSTKQEEIEEAKKLIESCQKTISDCEYMIEISTGKVETEIKRINGLVNFITTKGEQK